MDPTFTVRRHGAVARIDLARPEASNALGPGFWWHFADAVRALDSGGDVRALVLTGEGRHFCAGIDLLALGEGQTFSTATPGERESFVHVVRRLQATLSVLEQVRFPVLAAVQGACLGAGLELVAACDLRFASDDAFFRIEEINIGMMADVGSLQRLPRLLPDAVMKELAYLGRTLSAAEARQLGFVSPSGASSHEQVVAAALEAAKRIAERAPLAVAGTKAALLYARDHTVQDGLAWAALAQSALWSPDDIATAITSRAQKSAASFADLEPMSPQGGTNNRK